ncbi:MAG: DUF2461 domain-containing protein [Paludibacteraceae bacterium]|nr:DUF2461 domain-containing protein [Paludibacteraceae bacterium]
MKEILDFLTELSCNNNREWFNAHKDWYRDCHLRFEQFTANWLACLADIDPELATLQPKDCIWRIYRDVRFSHDKRPFKEWFGVFPAAKGGKKSDRGGYYIHVQPDKCMFAGGMWCPNKDLLHAVRREILANYDEVEDIFANPLTNRYFQDFDTDQMLKKVPLGFPTDFVHADWLKRKAYTFSTPLTNEQVCSLDFLDLVTDISRAAKPINDFLNYTFEEYGEFPDRR